MIGKKWAKTINFIFGFFMLLILLICFWGTGVDYAYKKEFDLPNVVYALLGICSIFIVKKASRLIGVWLQKSMQDGWWMIGLNILLFLGLVVLSYHYYFKTGWDAEKVQWAAEAIAKKDWVSVQSKYFSYYPNNTFLAFLFAVPMRLGAFVGIADSYFCTIIFQCFLFACAGYIIYDVTKMLANEVMAFGTWLIYVLVAALSPWVVIPYSDATGLLFPLLLFWLYLKMRRSKVRWIYMLGLSCLCYVGYSIKPQIAITGIAMILVTILSLTREKRNQWKKLLVNVGCCLAGFIFGVILVTQCVKETRLEIDEGLKFGLSHFIMLGLNEEYGGVINIVDQDFSMSFVNTQTRNAANLQVAKERLEKLGIKGLLKLWKNKTLTNFSDGTFAWWQEGEFYTEERYEGVYGVRAFMTSYYYENGSRHGWFMNYSQILWMGILCLAAVAFFYKSNITESSVLKLTIIGLIIFETIFEARARYLFVYLPMFVLLASIGINIIEQKINEFIVHK